MTDKTHGGAGGEADDDKSKAGGDGDDKNKQVSYETYSKLLDQRKSDQKLLNDLKTKVDAFEAEKKTRDDEAAKNKEKELEASGNWKAILEDREKKLKEEESKAKKLERENARLKQGFDDAKKLTALQQKLGGTLKDPAYYDLVDTSKIAIDPESGKVDDSSLQSYANDFLKRHKSLVDFGGKGSLPDGAAKGGGKGLTYAEWQKLPSAKEKRERMKDVID